MALQSASARLFAAVLLLAAGPAHAQSQGPRLSLFGGSSPSLTSKAEPPPQRDVQGEGLPWSGEDGPSGDPLMTAAAIRRAAANFEGCIRAMAPDAARRHIGRSSFDRLTAGLTPDLRIMDLLDAQPEYAKPIWSYLDILVSEDRLAKGREILSAYRKELDAAERTYGVDRYTIVAIWGIETNYSTQIGDRNVLQSTATLACIGRRQPYFREEFLSALEILSHGDLRPEQLRGSWAGAFGPTQFMPTAFKRYAVDADGDGRRDVVDNPADLIASTANNLKRDGWRPGETWGYEVKAPQGFNYLWADGARTLTIAQWEALGVRRATGQRLPRQSEKASLLAPAGASGPAFLLLQNFKVIMSYNPAEAYALAIGHFADRLRGGAPFVQPWPRQERALSLAERLNLQQLLASRGFYRGSPDGQFGSQTRQALQGFQASIGVPADGFASAGMLERLRAQ